MHFKKINKYVYFRGRIFLEGHVPEQEWEREILRGRFLTFYFIPFGTVCILVEIFNKIKSTVIILCLGH